MIAQENVHLKPPLPAGITRLAGPCPAAFTGTGIAPATHHSYQHDSGVGL